MPAKTKIIGIGDSQGVQIPLDILEQAGISGASRAEVLGQDVELVPVDGAILIQRVHKARAGWSKQFALMAEQGDDELLDDISHASSWDEQDWVWPA